MFSLEQYRALRDGAGLVNRSDRGRLRLTGADRRDYLQGLLTNDIAALSPGSGCYACLLTAQGRMIADMYVLETGDAILIDLESGRDGACRRTPRRSSCSARTSRSSMSADRPPSSASSVPTPRRRRTGSFESHGSAPTTADLESLRVLENRTWNWSAPPEHSEVPSRSSGATISAGWVSICGSGRSTRMRSPRRFVDAGARRRGSRSSRRLPDREWPAAVRTGHDERHDSARGRDRGPRDQPDQGLLRRPGDHHPRAAPRPRPRGAPARRLDARSEASVPGGGSAIRSRRSRDWRSSRARHCRPRWGGRSRWATCTGISWSRGRPSRS